MIEMRMDTFFFTLHQMYHIKAGNGVRHYSKGKVCFYWVVELRSNPRMLRKLCFRGVHLRGDFQGPISCWLLLHFDLFKVFYVTFFHGKSPSNHHLGKIFNLFQAS